MEVAVTIRKAYLERLKALDKEADLANGEKLLAELDAVKDAIDVERCRLDEDWCKKAGLTPTAP